MDDFLVDLYFYFDKSTKRKAELASKFLLGIRQIPDLAVDFSELCDVT